MINAELSVQVNIQMTTILPTLIYKGIYLFKSWSTDYTLAVVNHSVNNLFSKKAILSWDYGLLLPLYFLYWGA